MAFFLLCAIRDKALMRYRKQHSWVFDAVAVASTCSSNGSSSAPASAFPDWWAGRWPFAHDPRTPEISNETSCSVNKQTIELQFPEVQETGHRLFVTPSAAHLLLHFLAGRQPHGLLPLVEHHLLHRLASLGVQVVQLAVLGLNLRRVPAAGFTLLSLHGTQRTSLSSRAA